MGDCRNIVKTTEVNIDKPNMPEINPTTILTSKSNNYHLVTRHCMRQIEKDRISRQAIGSFGSTLPKHEELF